MALSKKSVNEELVKATDEVPASVEEISALLKKGADPVTAGCGGDGESVLHYAVRDQPCEIVKLLLDHSDYDVNHVSDDEFGPEPLIYLAAENPDFRVFSMLINDYGADCPTEGSYNPVYSFLMSWRHSEINPNDVCLFLSDACHIDDQHIFWNAVRSNSLELCKYMYEERDVSLEEEDEEGYSAIHIAAQSYEPDVLKWLVEDLGVSPETENTEGMRPIHVACNLAITYQSNLIYLVKDCGVDMTVESDECLLPVHYLTRSMCSMGDQINGIKGCVEKLHLDFTAESSDGRTALGFTIYNKCTEMTKYLVKLFGEVGIQKAYETAFRMDDIEYVSFLAEECKFNLKKEKWVELYQYEEEEREWEDTPMMRVLRNDNLEIFKYCFEKHFGSKLPPLSKVPFEKAHICYAKSIINYLVSLFGGKAYMDCLLDDAYEGTWSAFCEAARLDDMDLLKYLVEEKCVDLEYCRHGDSSFRKSFQFPIHAAITNGNLEMVRYLVEECKCDPFESSPNDGSTVLFATKQNQLDIVDYLVTECGISAMSSVLSFAEDKLFKQAFAFIDKYGIDVDELFCCLCPSPNKNVLSFLKKLYSKYDIDLSFKDEDGNSALVNALAYGRLQTVKWLVEECGEDILKVSVEEKNALILAAQSENLELIRYLVEKCGFNVDSKDKSGNTVLIYAINGPNLAFEENFQICKYLIKHGADVNAISEGGSNVLHYAIAGFYDDDMFKWFVKAGADVNVINKNGSSPLHIAAEKGNLEIVRFLVEECGMNPAIDGGRGTPAKKAKGNKEVVNYLHKKEKEYSEKQKG